MDHSNASLDLALKQSRHPPEIIPVGASHGTPIISSGHHSHPHDTDSSVLARKDVGELNQKMPNIPETGEPHLCRRDFGPT